MKTIVYLVYGSDMFADEAIYSLRSALSFPPSDPEIRFVVYTDRPARFARLPVDAVTLDAPQLAEWIGPSGYHHRMKLLAFNDALERFEGSVAFVDTDTYFLRSPDRLFERIGPGRSILHVPEARLSDVDEPSYRALAAIVRSGRLVDASGAPILFDENEIMWNSGVIGVHHADRDTIVHAIALMDQIKGDPQSKPAHQVEQFVLGHYLPVRTATRHCDDVVFHYWYWDLKQPFRKILPAIVTKQDSWTELKRHRPRTSLVRKSKMLLRIGLRRLGFAVPGIRGSI